jgi:SAM-dependent methyltransferase
MLSEMKFIAQSMLTKGRQTPQNFLGARWVARAVDLAPRFLREDIALWMLSISPHYFYRSNNPDAPFREFVRSERDRNRESRRIIVQNVLRPHFSPTDTVLDYGCGPGFMALASSRFVGHVIGCDISEGALSCARALNSATNIRYINVNSLDYQRLRAGSVDVVYSFAVIQHVRDDAFEAILRGLARVLRPGGKVLLHVALSGARWRTEAEWDGDRSVRGRLKSEFGLHCFGRDPTTVQQMVGMRGFVDVSIQSLDYLAALTDDDVSREHLLVATRGA